MDLFEKYAHNGRLNKMGFLRGLSIKRTWVASSYTLRLWHKRFLTLGSSFQVSYTVRSDPSGGSSKVVHYCCCKKLLWSIHSAHFPMHSCCWISFSRTKLYSSMYFKISRIFIAEVVLPTHRKSISGSTTWLLSRLGTDLSTALVCTRVVTLP